MIMPLGGIDTNVISHYKLGVGVVIVEEQEREVR